MLARVASFRRLARAGLTPKATSEHRHEGGKRGAMRASQGSVCRISGMTIGQIRSKDSELHRATGAGMAARCGEGGEVETHREGAFGAGPGKSFRRQGFATEFRAINLMCFNISLATLFLAKKKDSRVARVKNKRRARVETSRKLWESNQTRQHIGRMIYNRQVGATPGIQGWFNIRKSTHVIIQNNDIG